MWAWIVGKVVAFGVVRALMWVAGAATAAAVFWLWNDYQDAKARVVDLRGQVEKVVAIQKESLALAMLREAQLRADLATARATSERRTADAAALRADIERIRSIERPDHEKACPIHPAILTALDQLRRARERSSPGR